MGATIWGKQNIDYRRQNVDYHIIDEISPIVDVIRMDIKKRFGRIVRTRRRALDMSQEELGEYAKLNRGYISDIERGLRNPSLEVIERIAIALDMDLAELFALKG